ncbi:MULTISPECIES: hypothetical protein [unclassified Sinorhizobium]|uniref:hypothetical protein n=1 Tax=unclassified Sinorhizobium TaxID=2613772 RepID=UPI003525616C
MKRSLMHIGLLAATVLVSVTTSSLAETLNSGPSRSEPPITGTIADREDDAGRVLIRITQGAPEDRSDEEPQEGPSPGDREGPMGIGHPGPLGAAHGPRDFGLELAAKLAVAETYVGVATAQHDAWQAYATALIDFLQPPYPDRPDRDVPLFAERLADETIARAEAAKRLKAAIEALRSALTSEQFGRLIKAEQAFDPRPGPPGFGHRGGTAQDGIAGFHEKLRPPPL